MRSIKLLVNYCFVIISVGLFICFMECSPSTPPTDNNVPNGNGQSVTINIIADNIAFNTDTITVPAGANVTLFFDNRDRVPHNLAVYETSQAIKEIFVGEIFTGPQTVEYRFTAPSSPELS